MLDIKSLFLGHDELIQSLSDNGMDKKFLALQYEKPEGSRGFRFVSKTCVRSKPVEGNSAATMGIFVSNEQTEDGLYLGISDLGDIDEAYVEEQYELSLFSITDTVKTDELPFFTIEIETDKV